MILYLLLSAVPAAAQDRPRIGLALSGGGARGAAHIGVIEMLEEMHVPIDYIAGTSMGAIVGGLYASGVDVETLKSLCHDTDWDAVMVDAMPRADVPYHRRRDEYSAIRMTVDLTDGFSLPGGLVAGDRLDYILRTLTLGLPPSQDFDRLPIPFRCVTTDIATGEMVVLDQGDLVTALRASMAIPGIFAPVELDGRKLVDGGVARNLPVDVVRDMGADIVIVVNISTPLYKQEDLDNFLATTEQLSRILTNRNIAEQLHDLHESDILIAPELGDITTGSFNRTGEAIVIGYDAALAARDRLAPLSVPDLPGIEHPAPLTIDAVHTKALDLVPFPLLHDYLHSQMQRLRDTDTLADDLFLISRQESLDKLAFHLEDRAGKNTLVLEPTFQNRPEHTLGINLELSDDFEGDSSFDVTLTHTIDHINAFGAQWRNEVQLGATRGIATEFYQPLDPFLWHLFIAPKAEHTSSLIDVFDEDDRIAEYRLRESAAGLDFGLHMGTWGELRFGIVRGVSDARLHIGDPALMPDFTLDRGAYVTTLTLDRLDSSAFPRSGYNFNLNYTASRHTLGADETFDQLEINVLKPLSRGRHTVAFQGYAATSFDNEQPLSEQFALGGFLNLSGLRTDQITGEHALLTEILYYYRLWKLPRALGEGIYVGGSLEAGNVWHERSDVSTGDLISSASIFMGADTSLGPVYLGYGHAENARNAFYLSLGRRF